MKFSLSYSRGAAIQYRVGESVSLKTNRAELRPAGYIDQQEVGGAYSLSVTCTIAALGAEPSQNGGRVCGRGDMSFPRL